MSLLSAAENAQDGIVGELAISGEPAILESL